MKASQETWLIVDQFYCSFRKETQGIVVDWIFFSHILQVNTLVAEYIIIVALQKDWREDYGTFKKKVARNVRRSQEL